LTGPFWRTAWRTALVAIALPLAACATRDEPAHAADSTRVADSAVRSDSTPAAHGTPTADSSAAAGSGWAIGYRSAGPVRFGVTPAAGDDCHYTVPAGAPSDLRFMAESGRVVRVDVDSAGPATDRGARVGMTEAEIQRLYPVGLRTMPHKYDTTGHYLVFTPPGADSGFRIVFETDGHRVTTWRAGVGPAVEYVERCG
jgi:hypothetical protein